ncbi:hypothetical protein [Novosphingobium lindaniclasticum]|uniref:hypothetical protein n=1 Tax=Novosphingobium lindaniclasticum TaxID=1329895 RepID=UPI001267E78F|nr:hypothetical protein [Novosphingobium lindaniclasticum]
MTVAASIGGGFLGAGMLGANPIGGIGMWPATLFGSFAVLVPAYFIARETIGLSRRQSYAAVMLAGFSVGTIAMPLIFGSAPEYTKPASEFGFWWLGGAFGLGSGISWIVAHHLTRPKARVEAAC